MTVLEQLLDPGVIAVVRARGDVDLNEVALALVQGGVTAIEATMTTPGALKSIKALPESIRSQVVIGVGSVLTDDQAQAAIEAGAQFVVTPVVRPAVVRICRGLGVPVICGAFSPTEALAAYETGADFIKLFPADVGGPGYIRSLLAPLPMLRIIPTSGVTAQNCGTFIRAGCVAVGVGSSLVSDALLQSKDWPTLTDRAREFVTAVRAARGY